jgi:hypothetical protein
MGIGLFALGIFGTIMHMTSVGEQALVSQVVVLFDQFGLGAYHRPSGLAAISWTGIVLHVVNYAVWLYVAVRGSRRGVRSRDHARRRDDGAVRAPRDHRLACRGRRAARRVNDAESHNDTDTDAVTTLIHSAPRARLWPRILVMRRVSAPRRPGHTSLEGR